MKKVFFLLVLPATLLLGGIIYFFNSPHKDWQGIHSQVVERTAPYRFESWYPVLRPFLNLPTVEGAKKVDPKSGQKMPDRKFLSGNLEVEMVEGGFYYRENVGQYSPGAKLVYKNLSKDQPVETLFTVSIINLETMEELYKTRTFVNVKPQFSQERSYGDRDELLFERPGEAPSLALKISLVNGFEKKIKIPARLRRTSK